MLVNKSLFQNKKESSSFQNKKQGQTLQPGHLKTLQFSSRSASAQ